jgi:hypothetical protein
MIRGGTQFIVGHDAVPPVPDVDVDVEDDPEDGAGDGVGVAAAEHAAFVMVFESNDTAPFRANARPAKVAPVFIVIDARARIFPLNEVVVSRVVDVSDLHHILHGSPPVIDDPGAVTIVDSDRNIQTPDPERANVVFTSNPPAPTQ